MGNVWHVAGHVDPDDVLDLRTPAQVVLAGLRFDWQWVVLRGEQRFYALTRKELAELLDVNRRAAARSQSVPDAPLPSLEELLEGSGFPPALLVEHDVWARELEGLAAGIGGGTRLRIIARVAGAPLVIWAHREDVSIDRSSPGGVRMPPPATGAAPPIPDAGAGPERAVPATQAPDPAVVLTGVLPPFEPPPPRPHALPSRHAIDRNDFGNGHGGMLGGNDDAFAVEASPDVSFDAGEDAPADAYAVEAASPDAGSALPEPSVGEASPIDASPEVAAAAPPRSTMEAAPAATAAADGEVPAARWINAEIEDHPAAEPLAIAETYTLAISIGAAQLQTAGAVGGVLADPRLRDPDDALLLTVSLSSNDFTIGDPDRRLKIGRDGVSMGKARFDIAPLRGGLGRLTAILHRDNNFVQQLDISLQVGAGVMAPASVVSTGRPIATSAQLSRRDIGLSIQPSPTGGFDCIVWGATSANVKLPISAAELDAEIEASRAALLGVVTARDKDGTRPFQTGIQIDGPARDAALRAIALAGYTLFQKLFFHPAADQQCQALGDWLIAEVNQAKDDFTLQILARDFPVPWAMLYLAPEWKDDTIDFERFIGMKLVVEQIPLRNDAFGRDTRIAADPGGLSVSLNLNTDIDVQMHADVVAAQETYWNQAVAACPAIRLRTRTLATELVDALNDVATDDQIVYFFCHAESIGLKGAGPGSSNLTLSGNGSLDLASLTVRAPARHKLSGAPLVFINACESGKLSPLFYNGFVPYFMSKGARGVIGTECKVPARFAEAWARDFFDNLLAGKPLGETMRRLRRTFYLSHGNPLGLLYGLHCSADTRIDPLPARPAV
jgi:hypothetical protein